MQNPSFEFEKPNYTNMKLFLNPLVINSHSQKYENSCVPMGVEFVLKLTNQVDINFYDLQNAEGNTPGWFGNYDDKKISQTIITHEFNIERGPKFPLNELFSRIHQELKDGRFVNCAWKPEHVPNYHAYIIYGFGDNEFYAFTKNHGNNDVEYISDMKSRLTAIQGSDILTFR